MPGREGERERERKGGGISAVERTDAFEGSFRILQRYTARRTFFPSQKRSVGKKKNLGIYKTYPFLSTFGRKFVRSFRRSSRDTIENRKRDVILKREISK